MKIERDTDNGEQSIRVTFGHWSWACIFLIAWLAGWSFFCCVLASHLVAGPFRIGELLFALPFFLGEIAVSCTVAMMIFGRTTIVFTRSGWTKFTGIGKLGVTKTRTFPAQFEIDTDETITHGKHGATVHYGLVVNSANGIDVPQVIHSSTDPKLIETLCEIVREVAGNAAAPGKRQEAGGDAESEAEEERLERELLAGPPPKGLSVLRDYEGRVYVTYRRVRWLVALVVAIVIAGSAAVTLLTRHEIPLRALVFVVVCLLFLISQLAYALFGKRTLTLDHGNGETFMGIGALGVRRRFAYGNSADVWLRGSDTFVNGERMFKIVIGRPGENPVAICTMWPNAIKPYLAALIRNPEAAPAAFREGDFA